MTTANKNYIPAEQAGSAVTWLLPEVGRGERVPSAEKEARDREANEAAAAKEVIEDVPPLKLPTAAEIEAVMDAARQDGYDAGFQAGLNEGMAEGRQQGESRAYQESQQQLQRLQAQLSELVAQFAPPASAHRESLQSILVNLVQRLTAKLVLTELNTPSPHIENLVQSCLAKLPVLQGGTLPKVYLHPDDLAYLHGESLMADIVQRCEWLPDSDISPGGCRISTPASHLDATIEARLAAVLESFEQGQLAGAEGPGDSLEFDADEPSELESDMPKVAMTSPEPSAATPPPSDQDGGFASSHDDELPPPESDDVD